MIDACTTQRFTDLGRLLLFVLLSGCAAKTYINEPLSYHPGEVKQALEAADVERAPELLVLLAFSGGGARAAALAFGVMQELSSTPIHVTGGTVSLLDEVDVISSVSGGSLVSAYFGLYGNRLFADFEERVLRVNLESELLKWLAKPSHWTLSSRSHGRSDMVAAYFDENVFDFRTFADMRREGPQIIINSTDIGTGFRVAFTRPQFDLFCSELGSYPVSRAVAASSAVPGLASPITLKNYAGQCGYKQPDWVESIPEDVSTTIHNLAVRKFREYMDAEKRPWIHLVDGGVSDNLGMRPFYVFFSLETEADQIFESLGQAKASQILIISVNAALTYEREWARRSQFPSATQVLAAVSSIQMELYNADTIHIVRESYEDWARAASTEGQPVEFDFVEVNIASVRDPDERAYLNAIPTNFSLDEEQSERLIEAARQSLRQAPGFQRFVERNRPVER